jgi:hypothetical protein
MASGVGDMTDAIAILLIGPVVVLAGPGFLPVLGRMAMRVGGAIFADMDDVGVDILVAGDDSEIGVDAALE